MRCFSSGKVYCLVLCPLRPDPCHCQKSCLLSSLSLSLSLFGLFGRFGGDVCSLALFSGAGETQGAFGVWGSPCVSASWPRSSSWIRTPCSASTPRLRPRTSVFFFSASSSFAGLVVVGLGFSGLGLGWVCWVGGLHFCLACKMYNAQFSHQWGWRNDHSSPLFFIIAIMFRGSGEDRWPTRRPAC